MDNLKHGIIAAVAAGAALAGAPAAAELYLGASIGQATLESSLDGAEYDNCSNWSSNYTCYDPDFEDSDTALKIYGGYMFNEYVGVEVTYYDLGSMSDDGLLYSYDGGEFQQLQLRPQRRGRSGRHRPGPPAGGPVSRRPGGSVREGRRVHL
jgi:opacity protein-like surface antigen